MVSIVKNSGESINDAIIILGATGSTDGVAVEYEYLEEKFGKRGLGWKLNRQSLLSINNKYYDEMDLTLSDGTQIVLYFDITDFFGKF